MSTCRRVLLVALVALMPLTAARFAEAQSAQRILVMPFENVTRDSHISWLGEGSAVLLADDLNALGASAITRDERRRAFERLQVPPAATLTDATVIRIGELVGASLVIVGTLQVEGDVLVVHARSIALEAGRIAHDVTDRGSVAELFATFERLARTMAPPLLQSPATIRIENPPVAAFENYIRGLLAQTTDLGVSYLNAALKADPTFDRARLALWETYEDQGEYARALDAARAVPVSSSWSPRARFLSGLSLLELKKYDESFAAFKMLADERPTASVLNNLGVVQLRRGGTPQAGLPTYYFNKAADADKSEPDYFFNLGYAYWIERDMRAAIYWLREAVRRNPADGAAHFVLSAALTAAGSSAEATRERELARQLSSVYQEWEKRPAADPVPKGLERVKSDVELPHASGGLETTLTTGQRDQQDLARFYVDRGRRLFDQDLDRDALVDLSRALFLSPYDAEAHLLIGRIHLRAGQVREAIDAFKISVWSKESAEAHTALAEAYLDAKDPASAETEAARALAMDASSVAARQALDRARSGR